MGTTYRESDLDPVMRNLCVHWRTKIIQAKKHKETVFQKDADECLGFYNGPRSWDELMQGGVGVPADQDIPDLVFKMKVNKAFEAVSLFGPALYYDNPVRTVAPRQPFDLPDAVYPSPDYAFAAKQQEMARLTADGVRSGLMESYLNYLPDANDLGGESRQAVEEAIIKGRGCLWTELRELPGADMRVPYSYFDTVDNLFVDPDCRVFREANWIAQRCVHAVWEVEEEFGLRPGTLKGHMESQAMQAEIAAATPGSAEKRRGGTADLIVYWKIYSKMGIGGRLSGTNERVRAALDMFGDYCYLVVAEGVPFPLNIGPEVQRDAAKDGSLLWRVTSWPTPYWGNNEWPVSVLDFHKVPNSAWPMALLKAGLGELKFLNWAMSFLAGHLKNASRDFLAVLKSASESLKTQLLSGKDLTLIEIEPGNKTIAEIVQFLQHPPVNGDIWTMIDAVERNFDKRVGLNDLLYGGTGATQPRSATEIEQRQGNANVRPEDMAKQVEAWMRVVARKEATVARWHLRSADVKPILGPYAGWAWDNYLATDDVAEATRSLDYDIEAGSTRRPNKETMVARTAESIQNLLPLLQAYAMQTGDLTPLNNLLADWARARDLNPDRYQLAQPLGPPALPAPPPGTEGGGTSRIATGQETAPAGAAAPAPAPVAA